MKNGKITRVQIGTNPVDIDPYHSAIIKFELADGTAVSIDATGELTTVPANKNYTYIKLVSFNLPDSAQPDHQRRYHLCACKLLCARYTDGCGGRRNTDSKIALYLEYGNEKPMIHP